MPIYSLNTHHIEPTVIRKHQKVYTSWNIQHSLASNNNRKLKYSRNIDLSVLKNHSALPLIPYAIGNNIDKAVKLIETALLDSSSIIKTQPRKHKPWFDSECKLQKKYLLTLLNNLKLNSQMEHLRNAYNTERKRYRHMLKEKRHQYTENQTCKLIDTCQNKPWLLFKQNHVSSSAPISPEKLKDHFTSLLSPSGVNTDFDLSKNRDTLQDIQWYNTAFTEDEVLQCILKTSRNKATGIDQISNEHLYHSLDVLLPLWTKLFNACLSRSILPIKWLESTFKLLYKGKGSVYVPGNYRGIALLCCPFKILTSMLNERLKLNIFVNLPPEQFGFQEKKSTNLPLAALINDISNQLETPPGHMYCTFVDFQKAFDNVTRWKLLDKLQNQFSVKGKVLYLIAKLLQSNHIRIDDGVKLSDIITQHHGVMQGDSLSPSLFILFIADLADQLRAIPNIKFLFYADDLVLYSVCRVSLQRALDILSSWSNGNSLFVNLDKTKVMKFRKGGRLKAGDRFYYEGKEIEMVKHYTYLGIILQTSLTFNKHLVSKKEKSMATIGTIKHLQSISISTSLRIFSLKIEPTVTYGFEVIAPYLTLSNILVLDKIKSRFLKRVLGIPSKTSNTLCFEMAGSKTLIYDIDKRFLFNDHVIQSYKLLLNKKFQNLLNSDFAYAPALQSDGWKKPHQVNRNYITRLSAHGFHHLICLNTDFHRPNEACLCKQCGSPASYLYHILNCPRIDSYIKFVKNEEKKQT